MHARKVKSNQLSQVSELKFTKGSAPLVNLKTFAFDHETLIARVPKLLKATENALQTDVHPMIISARFHGYYEYLHPFRDGNGRTGRLLCNYILMRKGHPLLTIYKEERQQYIAALKQIRTEGTDEHLTHFFFDSAIKHMKESLAQKQHNNRQTLFLF